MKPKHNVMKDVSRVYDSLIIFQNKVESTGAISPMDNYEDYTSVWAETRFLKGRNFYAARAANVRTDVEFIIRYKSDLDETMRIKLNNKYYNIEGILPLENERLYMVIRAYEIKYDM